ncbi:CDP-diacylglycerol--serine O-phosphatidyltransferase [Pokkaliibacter sp. CJK22405]|uniref:CDP-diacylglycerol--serine O-phosphatidyltransferase n=1 Tax=Pokkaliibacter sp. CJK22405 TaxID=3384615 RepID=UPI003984B7AF
MAPLPSQQPSDNVTPLPGHSAVSDDSHEPLQESTVEEHQDQEFEQPRKRNRSIYLLPNLFTTSALFSGFYAIIAGMNGEYVNACIAIFVSMILDSLDGRVARMTNTQSEFGAEYDSLADMVSFGVAPALVAFTWSLDTLGKLGWIAAFIYVAGAALRLARFNVQIGSVDKKYFIGLPSPSAAALVTGMVWVGVDYGIDKHSMALLGAFIVAAAGILMVSNVSYYSFKQIDLKGKVPVMTLMVIALAFAVIAYQPPTVLWAVFLAYAISGPLLYLRKIRRKLS